ncbi:unnamed protein product [Musa hybrid cultivar]
MGDEGEAEEFGGGLGHDGGELFEADDTVAVGIGLLHHVGELDEGQRLAHARHGPRQLRRRYEPVAVPVEAAEDLQELLLVDHGLLGHDGRERRRELVELHGAVAVGVHACEHRVDLVAVGLEAEGAEEGSELQLGQAAVPVHVEAIEYVAQLLQLLALQPAAPHRSRSPPTTSMPMVDVVLLMVARGGEERRGAVAVRLSGCERFEVVGGGRCARRFSSFSNRLDRGTEWLANAVV